MDMKPQRLLLEFAPQAPRVSSGGVATLLTAAVVLAFASLYVGILLTKQRQQKHALEQKEVAGRKPLFTAPRATKANPAEVAQIKAIRQTSLSLTTPWPELLAALESIPPNVALLSVEPSAAKQSFAITVEAAGTAQMLQYLRLLQANPDLGDATLVSHQLQEQAPGTPIRFQVRASWGKQP
jgi:Tfp pilus assembly protein PilN